MPHPSPSRLERLEHALDRIEAGLAGLALLALLAIALGQIIARELLHSGIPHADPLVRMLVLYVLFFGAARAATAGRHLKLDVLPQLLPAGLQRVLGRVLALAAAAISAVLAWAGWRFWTLEWDYTPDHERWLFALALVIPLGFGLIALHLALRALSGRALAR